MEFLACPRVVGVWMAPPCGTPDGLPNLDREDRAKVFSANKLYSLTAKIADYCFSNGLFFVIENPVRSLFWLTTPIQASAFAFPVSRCMCLWQQTSKENDACFQSPSAHAVEPCMPREFVQDNVCTPEGASNSLTTAASSPPAKKANILQAFVRPWPR